MKKFLSVIALISLIVNVMYAAEAPAEKKLTLKDAIFEALKSNLDLQIQRTTARLAFEQLKMDKSLFIPIAQLSGSKASSKEPSMNIYEGVDTVENNSQRLNLTVNQNLPFGGNLALLVRNTKSDTNVLNSPWSVAYTASAGFQLTQPILRGVGTLATKYQIYLSDNSHRINKYQLQLQIGQLVLDVETAYWELVYAYQNKEAVKMSLQRAMDWLKQNELKVKVGTAAPIEILSSKAQVASNESQLIRAEQIIQSSEEALKRILNMSKDSSILIPVDQPEVKPLEVNFDSFLKEAIQNRFELKQAQLTLNNSQMTVKYTKNQTLPILQLVLGYSVTGFGGTSWVVFRDPTIPREPILPTTNLADAWDMAFSRDKNSDSSISLNLQIPLWMSREKAQLSQAKINRERADLQLKNVENTIYSEVKDIVKQHETALKLVDAEKIALQLEEENLKAEEKRLSVGLSTNFNVLEYQRRVAAAQSALIRATIDYTLTQARINRILNRTFQFYGINFSDFYNK